MVLVEGNEPLVFDYGVAEGVRERFSSAALRLEGQLGDRAVYANHALNDFRGYFAEVFSANMGVARSDLSEIARALRDVSVGVDRIIGAAREEDERRRIAREYIANHDDLWEKARDWFMGKEPPPRMVANPAPSIPVHSPPRGERVIPHAGSGVSGGVSSARPDHLWTAASGLADLDDALEGVLEGLWAALDDFAEHCRYGTLDGSGPVRAVGDWLQHNSRDVTWLRTVAQAFEAAGGEGGLSTLADSSLAASLQAAGLAVRRRDIQVAPASISGIEPTTGFTLDPVNVATGNFVEPEVDVAYAGLAGLVRVERVYNSVNPFVGAFGRGWYSIFDERLEIDGDGVRWFRADGYQVSFERVGSAVVRAERADVWLASTIVDGAPGFAVLDNGGMRRVFTGGGHLVEVTQAGMSARFDRDDSGRVIGLRAGNGRGIRVEYAGGFVSTVSTLHGTQVGYCYDGDRLTRVVSVEGQRRYEWNEAGLIQRVISASGVVEVDNDYDERARVISQRTPFGRGVRFVYLPGGVTCVSDCDGGRADTWVSDGCGRLIRVVDSHGSEQKMVYDRWGHLLLVVERDGATTVHSYDDRGRRIRTVLPEGGEITYGWDDCDRLQAVITVSGAEIHFEYEGENRHPSVIRDGLGGVSYLEWNRGALVGVVDPVGVRVDIVRDEFGDPIRVTNAAGSVVYDRDAEGRITSITHPGGATERVTYDLSGNVIEHVDPLGHVTRFEWVSGQLYSITAQDGGVTELRYGSHGQVVETIDPLGRSVRRSFDDLGNVSQLLLPGGVRWGFDYDSLSRLTEVTDPNGNVWSQHYDVMGRLSSLVDPTGLCRTTTIDRNASSATVVVADQSIDYSFDGFGRVISAKVLDVEHAVVTYDHGGNVVEVVDSDGGLTKIIRDLAGRVVRLDEPDMVTTYEYDECGRISSITNSHGQGVCFEYTPDSRLAKRVSADGSVQTFTYDRAGRLVEQYSTEKGRARFAYDSCGRLIRASDAWSGTRRFTWDLAGQLTSVTNALGAITRFEYDDLGRCTRVIAPDGTTTTWDYDGLGRVRHTDGSHGPITYSYDQAGRVIEQTHGDGTVIRQEYDSGGQVSKVFVNGELVRERRVNARDYTCEVVDHSPGQRYQLTYDPAGRLVSYRTNSYHVAYTYQGHKRMSMTVNGQTTTYSYNDAGQLTTMSHPAVGDLHFSYTNSGQLASLGQAGNLHQWSYQNGQVVAHHVITSEGVITSNITRDDHGRITAITTGAGSASYGYDKAGQLTSTITNNTAHHWEYDTCGRITCHRNADTQRRFVYDGAVLTKIINGTQVTTFTYDERGRRTSQHGPDGTWYYHWDAFGLLTHITRDDDDGQHSTPIHISPFGTPDHIGHTQITWDVAASWPIPLQQNGSDLFKIPGGLAVGDRISTHWRPTRPTLVTNPWRTPPGAGFVNSSGHIHIHGLEWLTSRAYDPNTYSFLTPDPLPPLYDQVWAANPYHYGANNPLAHADPFGLRPATDADLDQYTAQLPTSKWEYALAGLSITGGIALMFTGIGGPAGLTLLAGSGALVSGGISIGAQKITTGSVDWRAVGVEASIGAVSGLVGGGTGAIASRFMARGASRIGTAALAGSAEGAITGSISYALGPGPHTIEGYAKSIGTNSLISGLTGGVMSTQPPWLSLKDTSSFMFGTYRSRYLDNMTDLYRVGDASVPYGNWYTTQPYSSIQQARNNLALPDYWEAGDPLRIYDSSFHWQHGGGQPMYTGFAAPQRDYPPSPRRFWPGGGHQVFLPHQKEYGGRFIQQLPIEP